MQKIFIPNLVWLLLGLLGLMLILLISCNNENEPLRSSPKVLNVDKGPTMPEVIKDIDIGTIKPHEPAIESSFIDFAPLTDPVVASPVILDGPIFLEPLPPPWPIAPITAPMAFAASVFDDPIVDPWQANYVGSYGVLPSRFQDHGPFLYSFDLRKDANIFQDDDLAWPPDDDGRRDDDDNG
jgi:hypothetical protein